MYVSFREIDIGSCCAGWYGRNCLGVSLLRTGQEGQGRYKGGTKGEMLADAVSGGASRYLEVWQRNHRISFFFSEN